MPTQAVLHSLLRCCDMNSVWPVYTMCRCIVSFVMILSQYFDEFIHVNSSQLPKLDWSWNSMASTVQCPTQFYYHVYVYQETTQTEECMVDFFMLSFVVTHSPIYMYIYICSNTYIYRVSMSLHFLFTDEYLIQCEFFACLMLSWFFSFL